MAFAGFSWTQLLKRRRRTSRRMDDRQLAVRRL
jgi:hypothetical protein